MRTPLETPVPSDEQPVSANRTAVSTQHISIAATRTNIQLSLGKHLVKNAAPRCILNDNLKKAICKLNNLATQIKSFLESKFNDDEQFLDEQIQ